MYSLEPPRWGGSNEYPQSMFWAEIWKISEFFFCFVFFYPKIMFTSVNPSFTIYTWGLSGSKLYRRVFVMTTDQKNSLKGIGHVLIIDQWNFGLCILVLIDVHVSSAPAFAQIKLWVGGFKMSRMSLEDESRSGRPFEHDTLGHKALHCHLNTFPLPHFLTSASDQKWRPGIFLKLGN